MNVRDSSNRLVLRAAGALQRLNARHPWSHNDHFHPWILRHVPPGAAFALDIGCGRGRLVAQLRERVPHVDGIDPDQAMAASAAAQFADDPAITIKRMGFLDPIDELPHQRYDLITMVAVLHWLELEPALERVKALLNPGGRLLVVTLAPPRGFIDTVWDLSNAITNPLIGLAKHPRRALVTSVDTEMPVTDSSIPFAELGRRVGRVLPGARLQRREGFRVTLRWDAP